MFKRTPRFPGLQDSSHPTVACFCTDHRSIGLRWPCFGVHFLNPGQRQVTSVVGAGKKSLNPDEQCVVSHHEIVGEHRPGESDGKVV